MLISVLTLLLAVGFGGFVLMLISVIALLSIFRQRRAWRTAKFSHATQPLPTVVEVDEAADATQPSKVVVKRQPVARITFVEEAEHFRLPVREGTPDQIVIQIDVPDGPNRTQANVQRIINYLKADSAQPANQANAS